MQFEILTDVGRKRTVNEDGAAVFTRPDGVVLALIADGMGGHRGGDIASSNAIRLLGEKFLNIDLQRESDEAQWIDWLRDAVVEVNRQLYEMASENEEYRGMGTTLEAAILLGHRCIVAHIGDSRVYVIHEHGIVQVTKDHSYVNVLLESGEITEEEAAVHPQRNWIMKAIGTEKTITPDFYSVTFEQGAYLLLCTDGLSNKVEEAVLFDVVISSTKSLRKKVEELVGIANKRGGEDNISVILLRLSPEEVEGQ